MMTGFSKRWQVAALGVLLTVLWPGSIKHSEAANTGQDIFQSTCAVCHSIGGGRLVGPDLAGVNDRRTEDWLLKYIKSPQTLIKSGDKTAVALFEEYKIVMPDNALSDGQIKSVLAHIKDTGDSPAAGREAVAPTAQASAAAPTPDEIRLGQDLYEGRVRFANGGPACSACHHVSNDAVIGGGILSKDLTTAFSRIGKRGVIAIVGNSPFRVMELAYAQSPFTDDEIHAVVAFLEFADKQHRFEKPSEHGWSTYIGGSITAGMIIAGAAGVVVLLGFYALVGRRRKKRSVNQDIYDRQVKSE